MKKSNKKIAFILVMAIIGTLSLTMFHVSAAANVEEKKEKYVYPDIEYTDDAEDEQEIIEPESQEELCRCCHGAYADKWYPHSNECSSPGSYCIFDLYCVLNCGDTEWVPQMGFELSDSCTEYCIIAICTECNARIFTDKSVTYEMLFAGAK